MYDAQNIPDKDEVAFYATIPATVMYDKSLSPNAKLLYGTITSLCRRKGFCWASNNYLAELYNVERSAVTNWIKSLCAAGYISIEYVYSSDHKNILSRKIYLAEAKPAANRPPGKPHAEKGGGHIYDQGGGQIYDQGGQKIDQRSLELDIINRSAAAADPDEKTEPPQDNAAAADDLSDDFEDLKQNLKKLDSSFIFDAAFYGKARLFLAAHDLGPGYLSWLYEFCIRKKPNSLPNYFYRVFFEPRFAELYREFVRKKPPPPDSLILCPVCGAEHKAALSCPVCALEPENRGDPKLRERHRRYFAIPPDERAAYEAELEDAINRGASFDFFRKKNEKKK